MRLTQSATLPPPPLRCDRVPPLRQLEDARRAVTERRPPLRIDATEPFILVESGSSLGLTARLGQTTLTIGRSTGLGLVLDDARVSRVHASLRFERGLLKVQDYGSCNGTWVDGRRVLYDTVSHGARLRIGDTVLRAYLSSGASAEDARTALALWGTGRDPATGLPHGGTFRAHLESACAARTAQLKLTLVDLEVLDAKNARRIVQRLPAEVRAFRQGDRRLALLGVRYGARTLQKALSVAPVLRLGCCAAHAARWEPSELLLRAHAAMERLETAPSETA
ncbi:MAG: FHA domain-containing protein [Deltaproteobacteria bacterium]|nr:MAG: FHA domain-containing protein [Deltaproteobacteria bacterium]